MSTFPTVSNLMRFYNLLFVCISYFLQEYYIPSISWFLIQHFQALFTLHVRLSKYCRPSYEQSSYIWISKVTDEICWLYNFDPQWEYIKFVVLTVNYPSSHLVAGIGVCSVFSDTHVRVVVYWSHHSLDHGFIWNLLSSN
jgi:hypothetical protein